jgi:hypothetical protein
MIKIEAVDNGWIITDETDPDGPNKVVVQADGVRSINPSQETMEAFVDLLWRVNNLIGPTTSRYSSHRLSIDLVKGDKCEVE